MFWETKWIKPISSYNESDIFALGYDNKSPCKQYKIPRMESKHDDFPIYNQNVNHEYEICDFTSDSWKVGGVTNDWCLEPSDNDGMSMKGNTYWLCFDMTHNESLLSFDFSTENFQSLSLPDPSSYIPVALSVVREEQLILLTTDWADEETYVWVTTSTGPSMSWTKFLTLEANFNSKKFKVSFLIDQQHKVVVWCSKFPIDNKILNIVGENKHIRVDHGGDSTCMSSCDHFF